MTAKRPRLQGSEIVWLATAVVAVVVGATFAGFGTGSDGIRAGIRNTARLSLILLFPAFIASATAELWRGPFSKWLLRRRRHFGLAFAVSHFTHLALIGAYLFGHPDMFRDNVGAFGIYGGGAGYLFLFAMTVTSFKGPTRWLGRRKWNVLHKSGMYIFWGIFASSYIGRAITRPAFIPLALLIVVGVALRVAAFAKKRARRRSKAERRPRAKNTGEAKTQAEQTA